MNRRSFILAASAAAAGPAAHAAEPPPEVAWTYDDLVTPHGFVGLARAQELTGKLLRGLQHVGAPATGFVNERTLETVAAERAERTALLTDWVEAGMDLGNHTYSHLSLRDGGATAFKADVVRGEPVTRELLAQAGLPLRWFRHPYLHTGLTTAVRREIDPWLLARGYTVAPVTLDNADYVFAALYADARTRGADAEMKAIADEYLGFSDRKFAFQETAARQVFGRPIRHVLLLHANELNADTVEPMAALLRRRGYRFVPLERAMADTAYSTGDDYAGPNGVSWLWRWARTRKVAVKWSEEPEPSTAIRTRYDALQAAARP